MKTALIVLMLSSPLLAQHPSRTPVGECDGCEGVFEYDARRLAAVDTLPDFAATEPKLKLTGVIYRPDGKTPAEGVILYIYHTDRHGIYPKKGNETGTARQHGYIRGWVKTGKDGRYTFYTFRPGGYPSGRAPEHIHPIIAEPDGRYYWVNEFLFDDDKNLTDVERRPREVRGSHGVVRLKNEKGIWVGERDFVLGKGIPRYGAMK
jgi:protocatechuate 3,4-dioxygenase beta subunit